MIPRSRGSRQEKSHQFQFRHLRAFHILLAALWCLPTVALAQGQRPIDTPPDVRAATPGDHENHYGIRPQGSPSEVASETVLYRPLTSHQRVAWWVHSAVGSKTLATGILAEGIQTARDVPEEYGPGWAGFGKRYAMHIAEGAVDSGFEDFLGAAWGEDPRYFSLPDERLRSRIRSVIKQAFVTRRKDGTFGPAYARFVAIPSGNFLSNTWRAHNENTFSAALLRTTYAFAWRLAGNAFDELWPDAKQHLPFVRSH